MQNSRDRKQQCRLPGLRCGEVLVIQGHTGIWGYDGTVLYLDSGGDYMTIYFLKLNHCTRVKFIIFTALQLSKLYLTRTIMKDAMVPAMHLK